MKKLSLTEQKQAARAFAEKWANKGDEKRDTQSFWRDLLREVFGVENLTDYIKFEYPVKLGHTSFIDGYIAETRVVIEQKSLDKDLGKPSKQSDGSLLSPFQQAKRYAAELPYSARVRWIITCNFREFWVYDMDDPRDEPHEKIRLSELEKDCDLLKFLVNANVDEIRREQKLSVKAGEIVGKIYDTLAKQYRDKTSPTAMHSLNVLCVRLVFCLYAENAGIFGARTAFHDYLKRYSAKELREKITGLFKILDTKEEDRDRYDMDDNPELAAFPYVNGGLFSKTTDIEIPSFNDEIRTLLLDEASAGFNWADISPTIFGAVFESTLNPETRRSGGMHFTSIQNIEKVIRPLFLDDLNAELEQILKLPQGKKRDRQLHDFQNRLSKLRFLDPACGCGNFLTESFIQLRDLENKLLGALNPEELRMPLLSINQFYGIEINDFAVAVAKTAMWIAESQMFLKTEAIIGKPIDLLPLKTYTNIVRGNALKMDWSTLENEAQPDLFSQSTAKPRGKPRTVTYDYIMGNPPFVGASLTTAEQKSEVVELYNKVKLANSIDYVAGWYYKASELIQGKKTRCALVSTNSIFQGEQVAPIWKTLHDRFQIHIDFAYPTFIWDSESNTKAHVHCVVVGFSSAPNNKPKRIYEDDIPKDVENINGYLVNAPDVFIESRRKPLCDVPEIRKGNQPTDGGNFILTKAERDEVLKREPALKKYIKTYLGAEEFIKNRKRYCFWLRGIKPHELAKSKELMRRVEAVREMRLASSAKPTRDKADIPHLFFFISQPESGSYLLVPSTSSENRKYVPMGFMDTETISSNANLIIPNATLYEFGVLTSSVHMAWMRTTCGRLKSDYRYSNSVVYNNFPWPEVSEKQRAAIEKTAQAILDARALYPDSSFAELYDEASMPVELRKAHQANDKAVMAAYGFKPKSDGDESELVIALMRLWQDLTRAPQARERR